MSDHEWGARDDRHRDEPGARPHSDDPSNATETPESELRGPDTARDAEPQDAGAGDDADAVNAAPGGGPGAVDSRGKRSDARYKPDKRRWWWPANLSQHPSLKGGDGPRAGVDFAAERDNTAAAALPLLAVALGLMLLLAAFFRLQPADSTGRVVGVAALAVTGLGLLGSSAALMRSGAIRNNAHQIGTVMLVVAGIGLSLSMVANVSLAQTVYTELLVVCAGAVLMRLGWFIAAVVALWALWLGVAALLSGTTSASGYLLAMLGATVVAFVIHTIRGDSIRALATALQTAEDEAVRDQLTGLLNRRGVAEVGLELLALARRDRTALACTFVDVDGLKRVNDQFGHEAGDRLITDVAQALLKVFREADVVARWGGDEFVVLALGPGPTVGEVERRLADRLAASDLVATGSWTPQVSAGRVVQMPWQSDGLDALLERADEDMYRRRRIRRAREAGDGTG